MRKNMMRKPGGLLILLLLLMAVSLFGLTACQPENQSPAEPPAEQAEEPVATTDEWTAKLYYVNPAYVDTGDESQPHFIVIDVAMKTTAEQERPLALLEQLKAAASEDVLTMLGEDLQILGVKRSADDPAVIEVDLSSQDLIGSSLTEQMLIGQIAGTLLNNPQVWTDKNSATVPRPAGVRFLVDGQAAESLMGHFDVSVLITMDDTIFKNE